MTDPTRSTYNGLTDAYDFFNRRLFGDRLPPCLITMQRRKGVYGYFAASRFGSINNKEEEKIDEIAMNPTHFRGRTTEQSLSTLVHEMCHLQQEHFGKPSRVSYHNKEWAEMMEAIGLTPSSTGAPGGKKTGQKVSHYIEAGGKFETACREFVEAGFAISYGDRHGDDKGRAKKQSSKTKYTCPECGLNAWGKPEIYLTCGNCDERMAAEE